MILSTTLLSTRLYLAITIAIVILAILIILISAAYEYFTLDDDEPKDLNDVLYNLADNCLAQAGLCMLTILFFVSIFLLLFSFIYNLLV